MITIQKRIKLYESMILNIKENKCFGLQDEKIQIIFTNFSFEVDLQKYMIQIKIEKMLVKSHKEVLLNIRTTLLKARLRRS